MKSKNFIQRITHKNMVVMLGLLIFSSCGRQNEYHYEAMELPVEAEDTPCRMEDITWSDPNSSSEICSGPFAYAEYPTCVVPHKDCPSSSPCGEYHECRDKSFGVWTPQMPDDTEFDIQNTICKRVDKSGKCIAWGPDPKKAEAECVKIKNNFKNEVVGRWKGVYGDNVAKVTSLQSTYALISSSTTWSKYVCHVTLKGEIPKMGRGAACGCIRRECSRPDVRCCTTKDCSGKGFGRCVIPHKDCEANNPCGLYRVCRRWDFGSYTPAPKTHEAAYWIPNLCKAKDCRTCPCSKWEADYTKANSECNKIANNVKSELSTTYQGVLRFDATTAGAGIIQGSPSGPGSVKFRCSVRIDHTVGKQDRDPQCGCELHRCEKESSACPHGEGASARKIVRFTQPNTTRPSIQPSDIEKGIKSYDCTTCEHLPAGSPDQAKAKFRCLYDRHQNTPGMPLPPGNQSEPIKRTIRSYIKILFEHWGDELGSQEGQEALNIYQLYPDDMPSCGNTADLSGSNCAGMSEINWRMKFCSRLLSSHADAAVSSRHYASCLDIFDRIIAASSNQPDCSQEAQALNASVLDKIITHPGLYADVDSIAKLIRHLNAWYHGMVDLSGHSDIDPVGLDEDLFVFTSHFWATAEQTRPEFNLLHEGVHQPNPDMQAIKTKLKAALSAGFSLDQDVVRAAFLAGGSKVFGAPLALLTGQALTGLIARLEDLGTYQDIACRYFMDCSQAAELPPLNRLWRLLAYLDDGDQLSAIVNATVPTGLGGWKDAVQSILANQSWLVADTLVPLATGTGGATPVENIDINALSTPYQSLVKTITLAKERHRNFTQHGSLESRVGNHLKTAVHASKRAEIKSEMEADSSSLDDQLVRYDADFVRLVDSIMSGAETQGYKAEIERRKNRIVDDIEELKNRLSAHILAAERGDLATELTRALLKVEGGIHADEFQKVGGAGPFVLKGEHARYTGGQAASIVDLAVEPGVVPVQRLSANQMLLVNTEGQWSPACSLTDRKVITPDGQLGDIVLDPDDPYAGPEGYTVQWTGSGYQAHRITSGVSENWTRGVKAEVCGGLGTKKSFILSANICAYTGYEHTKTWQDMQDRGAEARTSASFASGLRLSNTPFSQAPVGSLLAVQMPAGKVDLDEILDIHLVRGPQTVIQVGEASDLYFVVNDLDCDGGPSLDNLRVEYGVWEGSRDTARQIIPRMGCVLDNIRLEEEKLIQSGQLLSSEVGRIRSEMLSDVMSQCEGLPTDPQHVIPVSEYPEELKALFLAFVEREIARLERAVAMYNIQREIRLITFDLHAIKTEEHNIEKKEYLNALQQRRFLTTLDTDYVRPKVEDLTSSHLDYLYPILKLWYPHKTPQGLEVTLRNLRDVDLESRAGDLVGYLMEVAVELVDTYGEAAVADGNPEKPPVMVVLAIPRPCDPDAGMPCPEVGFRKVAQGVSEYFWQAVDNRQPEVGLTFLPEDLYAWGSGSAKLDCFDQNPVIRHVAFVVDDGEDRESENTTNRRLEGWFGEEQKFASTNGPQSFILINDRWKMIRTAAVLYANGQHQVINVVRKADPVFKGEVLGLSPLGTLSFDFGTTEQQYHDWHFDSAKVIYVVFEIETTGSGENLDWIETCRHWSVIDQG